MCRSLSPLLFIVSMSGHSVTREWRRWTDTHICLIIQTEKGEGDLPRGDDPWSSHMVFHKFIIIQFWSNSIPGVWIDRIICHFFVGALRFKRYAIEIIIQRTHFTWWANAFFSIGFLRTTCVPVRKLTRPYIAKRQTDKSNREKPGNFLLPRAHVTYIYNMKKNETLTQPILVIDEKWFMMG